MLKATTSFFQNIIPQNVTQGFSNRHLIAYISQMSTHTLHENSRFYFVTFTCHKWINLLDIADLYPYFVKWIKELRNRGITICGYVFMPNHIHLLVYAEAHCKSVNLVIGDAKRFLAYKIVNRLERQNNKPLLRVLASGVQPKERLKGKKHQVFKLSFDAKVLEGEEQIMRVLDYIHMNPVSKKWKLVEDYTQFPYSSACYYENGEECGIEILDFRDIKISDSN